LIDLSNIRTTAWQRVVAELTASAPDDRVFLLRMLCILGQVSGGRQAVFHEIVQPPGEEGEEGARLSPRSRSTLVWPLRAGLMDQAGRLAVSADKLFDASAIKPGEILHEAEAREAALQCAGTRQAQVFGLDGGAGQAEPGFYDAGPVKGALMAIPILAGPPEQASSLPLHGVVTVLLEPRSKGALQSTLAMAEVLAGYAFNHAAQRSLRQLRHSGAAIDLAGRLISGINATESFRGAALRLVNDACRVLGMDRVALGWVEGSPARRGLEGARAVRCAALSDTENLDRRMEMVQKLTHAMNECLDQEQAVLFPVPPAEGPEADAVLSQSIAHEHRTLAAGNSGLRVASVPLRIVDGEGERVVGVLLMESAGATRVDPSLLELVQATMDLVAPVLAMRHSDDRALYLRTWDSTLRAGAWAVGPRHTAWKLAGIAATGLFVFCLLYTTTYRVAAPAELRPLERRVISAPIDGQIATVEPGIKENQPVTKGQLLATLDTREALLNEMEAKAQVLQFDKQADEALRKSELAEATQSRAKADQSRARAQLSRLQIERSRITSPITGTIIAGDLSDRVGGAVKLGDKLFDVADLGTMVVVARVSDTDIAYIREGQTGEVSPKADPSLKVAFTVERVVPLAQADQGENIFEVRATLAETPAWFRPGMEGQARFDTVERSLAWIGARRIVDTLRTWLWW
jgi:multidrug resistance efflux pump